MQRDVLFEDRQGLEHQPVLPERSVLLRSEDIVVPWAWAGSHPRSDDMLYALEPGIPFLLGDADPLDIPDVDALEGELCR